MRRGPGIPGHLPSGSEFDETLMCCSTTTGSGSSHDVCATGYSYIPAVPETDPGSCVNYVAGGAHCADLVVEFKQGCGDGHQPDCEEHPDDPACTCDLQTHPNGCGGDDEHCPGGGTWTCFQNQCYCA